VASSPSILILGAGLQGCGIALELARRGHQVSLLDQDLLPFNRASYRNEGKIHLGLIYAADRSFATADLQLRGALCFQRCLDAWCGETAARLPLSTPFDYLVAQDSVVGSDELESHYERVDTAYRNYLNEDRLASYLGRRPQGLFRRSTGPMATWFAADRVQAHFATAELAVDTGALAVAIRAALAADPRITFLPGRTVDSVCRTTNGFEVAGGGAVNCWRLQADQVVNATWQSRIGIDQSMGVTPIPGWLHRLKYGVIARLPDRLWGGPSATMVLGRYGDVVVRPDGTGYLSWYPSGLRGWSHDLRPPAEWGPACRGEADSVELRQIGTDIIRNVESWYPGIGEAVPIQIDAGAIFAYGTTDVDDESSGLHDRARVGVFSIDGYHSVDPGKLTTAPLFALEAADRIEAGLPRRPSVPAPPDRRERLPRVVALMPAYRAEGFIEPVLQSIANQTYTNLELIISDDCSPDGTAEVCERFIASRPNMRLVRQPANLGWVRNVNALFRQAEGDYYFFAFHDDVLEPTYVEKLVHALEANPGAILAYSALHVTDTDGSAAIEDYTAIEGLSDPVARVKCLLRWEDNWWVPNRGLFRAEAPARIGGMKSHWGGEYSADLPWLLHMSVLGPFVRVPEVLCRKRFTERSLSKSWQHHFWNHLGLLVALMREVHLSSLPRSAAAAMHLSMLMCILRAAVRSGHGRISQHLAAYVASAARAQPESRD
jgi:glycine/D-amino acid oxidase-like deaminating enzyme